MILKFKKGFSLVELLVVIAIIGILAAVGITAYQGYTTGAKEKAVLANEKQIVQLINAEFAKCASGSGNYPWGKWISGTRSSGPIVWTDLSTCDRLTVGGGGDPSDFVTTRVSAKAIAMYINKYLELKNPWDNTDTTVAILTDPGWTDGATDVGHILIVCGADACTVQSTINKDPVRSAEVSILYY
jgi:prepilin-type N-terminal cleavage/methylation domain-containing protein